jgi:hypothetical protein
MFIILGLVILIAAVVAGVAGVLANGGHAHAVTHFAVFGYHVTGSTGTLFLYGIVVGAIGVLGLSLLLAGARRTSRRGREARHSLKQSRRETATASQARNDLIEERDAARAYTASNLGDGAAGGSDQPEPGGSRWNRLRLPGHHAAPAQTTDAPAQTADAPAQTADTQPQSRDSQPAPGVPADLSPSADSTANGSRP